MELALVNLKVFYVLTVFDDILQTLSQASFPEPEQSGQSSKALGPSSNSRFKCSGRMNLKYFVRIPEQIVECVGTVISLLDSTV